MPRVRVVVSAVGVVALIAGCSLVTDLSGFATGAKGEEPDATTMGDSGSDATANSDSGSDATMPSDSGSDADAGCGCTNLVSAYRFSDVNALGHDYVGNNSMTSVKGAPKQSTVTPPGRPGYSIELNGSSSVCIESGFTFKSPNDHTLCWWSQPTALAIETNQFAQECGYDTWTANGGADYLWRINNCNAGTAANLQVANVYVVNQWVQICETYVAASLRRTVVINGKTGNKYSVTDTVPIVESPTSAWCIGSYGTGGFWTGRIYEPMWFDRVLSDKEIEQVATQGCCLP